MTVTAHAPSGAFLTQREVAELLRLSELTIHRLVERGLLACYRLGRRVRFRVGDVEVYLAARRHGDDRSPHGRP